MSSHRVDHLPSRLLRWTSCSAPAQTPTVMAFLTAKICAPTTLPRQHLATAAVAVTVVRGGCGDGCDLHTKSVVVVAWKQLECGVV